MKKLSAAMCTSITLSALLAGTAFAANLAVYADENSAAFKELDGHVVKLAIPSDYDAEAEAALRAGIAGRLRLEPYGEKMTIETVEFDEEAENMLRTVRVLYEGPIESGRIYEMPYGGLVETIPSLRVKLEDELGSVTWLNQMDGESGATEFMLSTEKEEH